MYVLTKAAAAVEPGDDDASSKSGSFDVILSAPTLDRDGETLLPEEWEQPLPDHITFDVDHGMDVKSTVGSGVPSIDEDGNLRVKGTYSSIPAAQTVRTLVNEGHIRTTSVAYMSKRAGKGKDAKVLRELLNGAFVAVPANKDALVLTSKALKDAKRGARHNAADLNAIQEIHQGTVQLGATCNAENAKALRHKSIVGSLEATVDRVSEALREANPGVYVWIRGTLADDGYVVFELTDPETYESETWKQSFTDDGDEVTLVGTATMVDIAEVVTPEPSTDDDAQSGAAAPVPAAGAAKAAPAAGTGAAAPDDAEAVAIRARGYAALAHAVPDEG